MGRPVNLFSDGQLMRNTKNWARMVNGGYMYFKRRGIPGEYIYLFVVFNVVLSLERAKGNHLDLQRSYFGCKRYGIWYQEEIQLKKITYIYVC